ncbi:MAG TPA: hypothetical protein VGX91_08820 [Candidatus Cybelea sp.]|jgi:hypothetical protein|nr:hypothetical protein [Candidatus Cybelea sp.]
MTNMTNEEQQRIDRAIVEGRHVEAMILYRASTGVELMPARDYVGARWRSLTA